MRLEDNTYPLRASVVAEGWEPIVEAWLAKYRPDYPDIVSGFPAIEEAADFMAVYRLNRS